MTLSGADSIAGAASKLQPDYFILENLADESPNCLTIQRKRRSLLDIYGPPPRQQLHRVID